MTPEGVAHSRNRERNSASHGARFATNVIQITRTSQPPRHVHFIEEGTMTMITGTRNRPEGENPERKASKRDVLAAWVVLVVTLTVLALIG